MGAAPAGAEATFNSRLAQLINEARSTNGLPALGVSSGLTGVAEDANYSGCGYNVTGRAADMGNRAYFSHTILGCGSQNVFDMLRASGIQSSRSGENIGWMANGRDAAAAAASLHNSFMNSPGHRANVLNGSFNAVGVGSWLAPAGQTWAGGGGAHHDVLVTAVVFATLAPGFPTVSTGTPPPAPTRVVATAGNGAASVAWQAAAASPATEASVALLFDPTGYTGRYASTCATCTTASFGGLTNGQYYAVGVLSYNAAGWGPVAYSGWFAPGTPSAPRNVSASPAPQHARVSWAAPASANGAAIQGYAAVAYDAAGFTGQHTFACATCTLASVGGLAPGKAYGMLVIGYNAAGWGDYSTSNWVTPTT